MSSTKRPWEINSGVWLLILTVAAFAVYFSSLHIWYYGDDFQYLYESPASRIFHFFYHRNLFHGFYRPVNSSIIAMVQVAFGLQTWPIHVINILVHALLSWMVFLFMKRERFTTWQAVLGSAFMIISQENASGVLGNDTFSQISGTIFGCLTLWLLYIAFFDGNGIRRNTDQAFPYGYFVLSLGTYALCLASKETSVSFAPLVFLVLLIKNWNISGWIPRLVRSVVDVLPYFLITIIYVWLRAFIGLSQPTANSGTYGFQFGFNVLRNLGQFLFAAIIPASSATAFVAVRTRDVALLGIIVLGALLFLAAVVYGVWRCGRDRVVPLMVLFALIGLFPAMLMNHVGELYLYNSMPFISVLVGIGLGTVLERTRRTHLGPAVFAVGMLLLVIGHVSGIWNKAASMEVNGMRAKSYLPQIERFVPQVPPNGQLLLLNPPSDQPEYSVYLMKPFSVFKWGVHIIKQEAGREDFTVEVIEQQDLQLPQYQHNAVILGLQGDSVVLHAKLP